jgi:integrase
MAKAKKLTIPKRRRARGTGTIFERGGQWVARVPVGKYPGGGTRYVEVSAPTQAAVIERMKGVAPPGPDTTVSEWCERWLAQCQVRPSTLTDYRVTVSRWIVPQIGSVRVADLTSETVSNLVRGWKLGPNTAAKSLRTFRVCLECAKRARLITVNPASEVKGPRTKRKEIITFPPAELKRIIAAAAKPTEAIYALLAATGLRLGEALGANVEDYNAAKGVLRVQRTYDTKHGEREPKSENGKRTITVPAAARPALLRAIGKRKAGPLFPAKDGARRHQSAVRHAWAQFLERLELPYRSPHQLRHSVATALISAGVPIGDAARFLGDSVQVVVSTYLHAAGTDPAAKLDNLLK